MKNKSYNDLNSSTYHTLVFSGSDLNIEAVLKCIFSKVARVTYTNIDQLKLAIEVETLSSFKELPYDKYANFKSNFQIRTNTTIDVLEKPTPPCLNFNDGECIRFIGTLASVLEALYYLRNLFAVSLIQVNKMYREKRKSFIV